jgi:purine nucleoside phosphorylase
VEANFDRYSPPHLINQKSIIAAMHKVNVKRILAFASVGSLKKELKGSIESVA